MLNKAIILYHFFRTRFLNRQLKTREQLELYQEKRFRFFNQHVLKKSPYYRDYLDKPLSHFPIVDKKIMMENFDTMNTVHINREEALNSALLAEKTRDFSPTINGITIGLSSGTSGHRGIFLASRKERLAWVGIMIAKILPKNLLKPQKIAFFLRANSNLYQSVTTQKNLHFTFFDLIQPFEKLLVELYEYQPTILVAPASVLKLIALTQDLSKIKIKPQRIISVAEVLDPMDEKFIEVVFNQKIYQVYQATEGFIGYTDETQRLRLNEEYLYIEKEWVDKNSGRFIPIITDFTRSSQPIVRYRLDDVLVLDQTRLNEPYVYLKSIEGRLDDLCYLQNQYGTLVPLFPDILRRMFTLTDFIVDDYRVIQNKINCFTFQIEPYPSIEIQKLFILNFKKICESLLCNTPEIKIEFYVKSQILCKLKRIERHFSIQKEQKI